MKQDFFLPLSASGGGHDSIFSVEFQTAIEECLSGKLVSNVSRLPSLISWLLFLASQGISPLKNQLSLSPSLPQAIDSWETWS
jgi:hypothetical protein